MKRLIGASASEVAQMNSKELLMSIAQSEGRVLAAECIGVTPPLLNDVSNAEVVASMSADIVLLNMLDIEKPVINGLPECDNPIQKVKELTGRVIGMNLEPVEDLDNTDELWKMTKGRLATVENAIKAKEAGIDMICITGNPGNHVSNEGICKAIKAIKDALKDDIIIISGKMHASGMLNESAENIITKQDVKAFMEAGADIILIPAPGTVPGITLDMIHELVSYVHQNGKLTMTSIGTSQEGADVNTIRDIALMCKMSGTDIHHIGDSGYVGLALPENIQAYSIAIRGVRHTYHKMAQSIKR